MSSWTVAATLSTFTWLFYIHTGCCSFTRVRIGDTIAAAHGIVEFRADRRFFSADALIFAVTSALFAVKAILAVGIFSAVALTFAKYIYSCCRSAAGVSIGIPITTTHGSIFLSAVLRSLSAYPIALAISILFFTV